MDGRRRRGAERTFAQRVGSALQALQPLGIERGHELHALGGPLVQLLPAGLRAGQDAQPDAGVQVGAGPPALQRRQVVGSDGGQRVVRVRGGRLEAAAVALEVQQPVRQQREARQQRPGGVGHRAQVLADHHAAVALALQRDDGQQLLGRVVHVGAIGGGGAGRHAEDAREAHHVVDAQRARAAHAGAQAVDEEAVAALAQPLGRQRRQAPVLPQRAQRVGRRADAGLGGQHGARAPGVGAVAVHGDGQVLVQADAQAGLAAARGHGLQLLVGRPLQPGVEIDFRRVLARERGHGRRVGFVVFGRPGRPAPGGQALPAEVRLQRIEQRLPLQRLAARGAEGGEGGAALRVGTVREVAVQQRQHLQLGRGHAGVVDEFRGAQRCQPLLEGRLGHPAPRRLAGGEFGQRLDVDVQHVQVLARGRAVGAALARVVREQRVQRVQPDGLGAELRRHRHQLGQVGEVAHAPLPFGAQGVELHRDAPAALALGRQVAARGRGDQQQGFVFTLKRQPVVAGGQLGGQFVHALDALHAVDVAAAVLGALAGQQPAAAEHAAVLAVQRPAARRRVVRRAHAQREAGRAGRDHLHRRQRPAPGGVLALLGLAVPGSAVAGRVGAPAELVQQRGELRRRHLDAVAEDVVVVAGQAGARAGAQQGLMHGRLPRPGR